MDIRTCSFVLAVGFTLAAVSSGAVELTPANYTKKIEITASGYAGSETLANFPVLVRLSTNVSGFSYADFALANGGDLRFALEDGTLLASEIDTWNPSGESLVWVKVPALTKDLKIIAYYGNGAPEALSNVWQENYLGVWHFNAIDGDGVTPDSTENGLDMTAQTKSVQTAVDSGRVGGALVNATAINVKTGGFRTSRYSDKFSSGPFTVSGWFNRLGHARNGNERYFSSRDAWNKPYGIEMQGHKDDSSRCQGRGSWTQANPTLAFKIPGQQKNEWVKYTLVYDDTTLTAYTNGFESANGTVAAVNHPTNDIGFAVGNNAGFTERSLWGNIDEVRFAKVKESADWVRAEYETETKTDFLSYSAASDLDASVVRFAGPPTVSCAGGVFTVSVTTAADSATGSLKAVYGTAGALDKEVALTDAVEAGTTYSGTLTGLASETSYLVQVEGLGASGKTTRTVAENVFYNGTLAIVKGDDADELDLSRPGTIIVSRADTYGDLVVNYAVGGTAVAGVNYKALSGTVTIPDGQSSATLEIMPLRAMTGTSTVSVTLEGGLYGVDETAKAAEITVRRLEPPEGWNTWVAGEAGKASVAANWSAGVPKATDKVLFDGRFSNAKCEWDGGVNGVSDTIAALTLADNYSGAVSVATTYDTVSATFTNLTVTGDVTVNGGSLMSKSNGTLGTETYLLRMEVGGDVTVGATGLISAAGCGRYSNYGSWRKAAPHGGEMNMTDSKGEKRPAYDSIFEPCMNGLGSCDGTGGSRATNGGGAIHLVVAGDFVNNGKVTATSNRASEAGGSGGAVYVAATTISGDGTYEANGMSGTKSDGSYASGAGGRIALVASGANNASAAKISCTGSRDKWGAAGGAGTVYLTGSNVKALYVRNANDQNNPAVTPIPSPDDTYNRYVWRDIDITVGARAHLKIGSNVRANSISFVNGATDDLDLAGRILQVRDVFVGGVDLKLGSGDYTLSEAKAKGWTWLKDSSASEDVAGTGILRIGGVGMVIYLR